MNDEPLKLYDHWSYVGEYDQYLERAHSNLEEKRYFEAVSLCCICLEVLVNDFVYIQNYKTVDDYLRSHPEDLELPLKQLLKKVKDNCPTDDFIYIEGIGEKSLGSILGLIKKKKLLNKKMLKELKDLNNMRNGVIHPKGKEIGLRKNILPNTCTESDADNFLNKLSDLIEQLGGITIRMKELEVLENVERFRNWQQQRGLRHNN